MAKIRALPVEEAKPKVDVTLGGLEYPDGTFVCVQCYRSKGFRVKMVSMPAFKNMLTGKEICSVCSKSLKEALIIDNVAE